MNSIPATASIDDLERALRGLFFRLRTPRLRSHLQRHLRVARQTEAFDECYARSRRRVIRRLFARRVDDRWHPRKRAHWNELLETSAPHSPPLDSPDFHCDAGLGGLAKLLRAAGYDAAFFPGIDDDRLLNITATTSAVLLTNDWRLSQRGVFQHGVVPCLHVPITMKKSEQLVFVAQQLQLERRATRCMSCGGRLDRVERESVRDRIPPRTYDWGVDIHRCDRCDKVFWEGGHWDRLSPMLAAMPLATTSLATTSLAGRSLEATSIARPVSQPPQQPSPPATIIEP